MSREHPTLQPMDTGVPSMGQAVAARNAAAQPEDYVARYMLDNQSGKLVPRAPDTLPPVVARANITNNGDGSFSMELPALATGAATYNTLGGSTVNDWAAEMQDRWESMSGYNNADGKHEMRKARKYWKSDPLNYRCAGFLAELMNARLTIECEDEAFRDVVEIWLKHTMGHVFRDQYFRELVVTGMVPVIKTLIPYKPRAYRYNRKPRPATEDRKVELASGKFIHRQDARTTDDPLRRRSIGRPYPTGPSIQSLGMWIDRGQPSAATVTPTY